jgi:hypothetical protein
MRMPARAGAVEGLGGVVLQRVFDAALQQHGDPHAAGRGIEQGLAEAQARQEVGVGEQDFPRAPAIASR